ncbi:MAG: D-hexose-6-phosphate mutarotase [Verrucomicrobiota bacterium]
MSESNQLEIPGVVTLTTGEGGLRKAVIRSPRSSAEIYLHGAHVAAFQRHGEEPLLFMSGSSAFAPDKPIRGGIPIIFPWFGGREGMPAHGFARTAEWELGETTVRVDGTVCLRFALPDGGGFEVGYTVTVGESLGLELSVRNTGDEDADFESCLHTYFLVSGIDGISITGLSDTGYFDKVREVEALETSPYIRIEGEVDRVYSDTAAVVEIEDPGFGRLIRIEKTGSNSTVVWNPWIAKSRSMADFGDEEYLRMVCVESGNVARNKITLAAGERSVMKVEVGSRPLA